MLHYALLLRGLQCHVVIITSSMLLCSIAYANKSMSYTANAVAYILVLRTLANTQFKAVHTTLSNQCTLILHSLLSSNTQKTALTLS